MLVCDKITVRFKKSGKSHTIVAGTPFNEGDIPQGHLDSLRRKGKVREYDAPKTQNDARSLLVDRLHIKLPGKDKDTVGLNRNDNEKVFDNDPSELSDKPMAELRM